VDLSADCVRDFFEQLAVVHHAGLVAKRELSRRTAPDFNVIQIFEPSEQKLSKLICWLLDPKGSHGQKQTFLNSFLSVIGKSDWSALVEDWSVRTEWPTRPSTGGDRYIDVVGESRRRSDGYAFGVENKPWARDLPNQTRDYCEALARPPNQNWCLVYLTTDGRSPSESSFPERERCEGLIREKNSCECRMARGCAPEMMSLSRSRIGWLTAKQNAKPQPCVSS